MNRWYAKVHAPFSRHIRLIMDSRSLAQPLNSNSVGHLTRPFEVYGAHSTVQSSFQEADRFDGTRGYLVTGHGLAPVQMSEGGSKSW